MTWLVSFAARFGLDARALAQNAVIAALLLSVFWATGSLSLHDIVHGVLVFAAMTIGLAVSSALLAAVDGLFDRWRP